MIKNYLFIGIICVGNLITSTSLQTQNLIEYVNVDGNAITIVANPQFTQTFLRKDFFVEYGPEIDVQKLDYSIVTIPFLLNVMPIIWISKNHYEIESMDEDLYYSLQTLQKIFVAFFPHTDWSGTLEPKMLVKHTIEPDGHTIAGLFSHGLDAVHTSIMNRVKQQWLITICGADIGLNKPLMWKNVKKACRDFAKTYNHHNIFVRSNFNKFKNNLYLLSLTPDITNWFGQTSQALGYTGLAAPIAYTKNCETLLIASTRTSEYPFPYGTHPILDNSIAFAGVRVHHDSPERNRLEKIHDIVQACQQDNKPFPFLRVCWGNDENGGNCTKCEKCFRTIVELLVEGQLPSLFGFSISLQDAIDNTRLQAPGRPILTDGLMWHWGCIKKAAAQMAAMHNSTLQADGYYELLTWLANLDLKPYQNPHGRVYKDDEREAFTLLWHAAVAGIFTAQDLSIFDGMQRSGRRSKWPQQLAKCHTLSMLS